MPSTDKYAATTWGAPREFDFQTPSGQVCRLRRMDPTDLIAAGLLDNLDFLTAEVLNNHIPRGRKTAVEKAKEKKASVGKPEKTEEELKTELMQKAYSELLRDPNKFDNFKQTLNKVVVLTVVAPEIQAPPEDEEDREEGVIYADSITFEDRMAIFNKATEGASKLEQFREESGEAVGAVVSEPGVRKSAKRRSARN